MFVENWQTIQEIPFRQDLVFLNSKNAISPLQKLYTAIADRDVARCAMYFRDVRPQRCAMVDGHDDVRWSMVLAMCDVRWSMGHCKLYDVRWSMDLAM